MSLKPLREAHHLTQDELAARSGISVRTIQRIESGQVPKGHTLTALAQALEVEPEVVLGSRPREAAQPGTGYVKLINLSSLPVAFLPLVNVALPLILTLALKQVQPLTKQIVSLQIMWAIGAPVLFLLSAFAKNSLGLSNQFTLWVMIGLTLSNVIIILINTAGLDQKQRLRIRLPFSFW